MWEDAVVGQHQEVVTLYSLCVQWRPWWLFINFPLSLHFSQIILHRLSSKLWSFTFLLQLSNIEYISFWGIFPLCCRCIICNVSHWSAGSTLTCRESVTAFKRSVVVMRAHKANIDCEILCLQIMVVSCSWLRNVQTVRSGSLPTVSFTSRTNIIQSFCNVIPQTKAIQYAEPLWSI